MYVKIINRWAAFIMVMFGGTFCLKAQEGPALQRCGTMPVLENAFKRNPSLRAKFEKQTHEIQQTVIKRKSVAQPLRIYQDVVYVPIVFHIVLTNPALVTDAQVYAQLDTLNKDFAGMNNNAINIPAAFKPLFGKSHIQFKLAQRTPDDEPTTGIVRTITTRVAFSTFDASLKYSSLNGDDAWDHDRFLNVWITNLGGGYTLGYATYPGATVAAEDGVVIHYTSLPGSATAPFNEGRTLTHETGHYFYLYHIWGDENGCTGTDYVDDTPNQTTLSSGCPNGRVMTDACTPLAPGILYEDYMDYTDDACMLLFTNDQVTRMETTLNDYRVGYYTSNGAVPVSLFSLDAAVKQIKTPVQRVCTPTFSPGFILRNRGTQTLTSAELYASIDDGPATQIHWTGSLSSLDETTLSMNTMVVTEGSHILKVVVSSPNGSTDQNTANDTLATGIQYNQAVPTPLTEGFENNTFPPARWDIINPDRSHSWEWVSGVAKTGHGSVVMRNFNYPVIGQRDLLRMPEVNITSGDSAFLTFQVAAAVKSDPSAVYNLGDTLQVLASTDCGVTYTSLYKKWGRSLITRQVATTSLFIPNSEEWRKDSVNLTPYINAGPVLLSFLNTAQNENNIYLDDINVHSIAINPNLRAKGFLVTPNPTTGTIAVQLYPTPATLKGIFVYNSSGQKVAEQLVNGGFTTYYSFNLDHFANGVYIVQVMFSDKTYVQKVIKQ
jgi:hypothetical protein